MEGKLPVGPIASVSEEAIKAALMPSDGDYLYFVADINGDGKVYYSKTLEEHEKKMEELGYNKIVVVLTRPSGYVKKQLRL